jgi:hypothetical protein
MNMTFHFDEPVDPDSFDPLGVTLQDDASATYTVVLADADCAPGVGTTVYCWLGAVDKAEIATKNGQVGTTALNTFLVISK